MAWIRGSMTAFDLLQPSGVDEAVALLKRHGDNAWVVAGGLDTFDQLADGIVRPAVLVDLGAIEDLRGIRETGNGIEIGAITTLTDLARHPIVREKFPLLALAANSVASPQIRNQGTIGGNVSQNARCWYYRSGWTCYRAGGNICYGDTPTAANREHAIFDLDRCVAVNPSDTAPALIALDASMVIRSPRGERVVSAEEYFVSPAVDITHMTVLERGDLLTAIRIPPTWAGAPHYFEKVRDRKAWDFALVSIAAVMKTSARGIDEARIVVNGVSGRPRRLRDVEDAVRGQTPNEATATLAGDLAVKNAEPLRDNAYKVAMTRNLVRRAVRVGAETTT
jgi:xanthine dehydrogenase YagS FAD-binding subunit